MLTSAAIYLEEDEWDPELRIFSDLNTTVIYEASCHAPKAGLSLQASRQETKHELRASTFELSNHQTSEILNPSIHTN